MTTAWLQHLPRLVTAVTSVLAPPPAPRSLLTFASSLRITEGPQGPRPEAPRGDLLDPSLHPAQAAVLQIVAHNCYPRVIVLAPPQDGKDTGVCVPLALWALIELRRSVVYATTDRQLMQKLYRAKIKPVIEASGFGWVLPDDGVGSGEGAPDDLLLTCGSRLYMLGAGAASGGGQAGITGWLLIISEVDKVRRAQREKLLDRIKAWGDEGRALLIGTLDQDDQRGIMGMYDLATQGRLHHPCPSCSAWFTIEWDRDILPTLDVTTDATVRDTLLITCPHCHTTMDEETRRENSLLSRLVWAGQTITGPAGAPVIDGPKPPPGAVVGVRWWAADSPRRDLHAVASSYRDAVMQRDTYNDHETIREFYHTELVLPYRQSVDGLEGAIRLSRAYLAARSSRHGWADMISMRSDDKRWSRYIAPLPEAPRHYTVTVDVQENRLYWLMLGWLPNNQVRFVGWGYEFATTAMEPLTIDELHHVFDRIDRLVDELAVDARILVRATDVGHRQHDILPWLASHPTWLPLAGAGSEVGGRMRDLRVPGDLAGICYRRAPDRWPLPPHQLLHLVDVDRVREQAQNALLRGADAAGSALLPRGLRPGASIIRHLTGELLDPATGKWEKQPGRHDLLDCYVYGWALARLYDTPVETPPPAVRYGNVSNYLKRT